MSICVISGWSCVSEWKGCIWGLTELWPLCYMVKRVGYTSYYSAWTLLSLPWMWVLVGLGSVAGCSGVIVDPLSWGPLLKCVQLLLFWEFMVNVMLYTHEEWMALQNWICSYSEFPLYSGTKITDHSCHQQCFMQLQHSGLLTRIRTVIRVYYWSVYTG